MRSFFFLHLTFFLLLGGIFLSPLKGASSEIKKNTPTAAYLPLNEKETPLPVTSPYYEQEAAPWMLETFFPLKENQFPQAWSREDYATGDWQGWRNCLSQEGVDLDGYLIQELWGNTTGGITQSTVSDGALELSSTLDLEKLVHLKNGYFFSSWIYFYGGNPNTELVDTCLFPSTVAGYQTLRNQNLWIEERFWEEHFSLRVGQMMVNPDFFLAPYSTLFLNSAFAWPPFINTNIKNGGPAYPEGAPGIRLQANPIPDWTLTSILTQSNVEPQTINNTGFYWNLNANQGYFSINELSHEFGYRYPAKTAAGVWLDTSWYPNSDNRDQNLWGNIGIYGVYNQLLWPKHLLIECEDKQKKSFQSEGLGGFGRLAYSTSDRNIMNLFCDAGLTYQGALPTRHQDTCGIGFGYAQFSPGVIHYQENNYQENFPTPWDSAPIDSIGVGVMGEFSFEAMYDIKVTHWMDIKPDLQYLVHQGTDQLLGNSLVIGLQSTIIF